MPPLSFIHTCSGQSSKNHSKVHLYGSRVSIFLSEYLTQINNFLFSGPRYLAYDYIIYNKVPAVQLPSLLYKCAKIWNSDHKNAVSLKMLVPQSSQENPVLVDERFGCG